MYGGENPRYTSPVFTDLGGNNRDNRTKRAEPWSSLKRWLKGKSRKLSIKPPEPELKRGFSVPSDKQTSLL